MTLCIASLCSSLMYLLPLVQDKVDYVGHTSDKTNDTDYPCRYAAGIYNKDSGTLQLTPLQSNSICR